MTPMLFAALLAATTARNADTKLSARRALNQKT